MSNTYIFIHGGESFTIESEYLDWIQSTYVSWMADAWIPPTEMRPDWKSQITTTLTSRGDIVYMPTFPNKLDAKYSEWKLFFDAWLPTISISGDLTLIGNSLGGCFLLKYFADSSIIVDTTSISKRHQFLCFPGGQKHRIHQIHLIAACLECGDFTSPTNYEYLQHMGDRVHIWHAEDDGVVLFAVGQELSHHLGEAQTHFFPSEKGYGHFFGLERIEELEEVIFEKK